MAEDLLFLGEKDDKAASRKFLEARHAARLQVGAEKMTVTGLRMSDKDNPENGLVICFDPAEQEAMMAAIRSILAQRGAPAKKN